MMAEIWKAERAVLELIPINYPTSPAARITPAGSDGLGPGSTATSAAVIRGLDLRCRLTVSAETLAGLLLLDCPSLFNRAPRSETRGGKKGLKNFC